MKLHLIQLNGTPIFKQLQLEEALIRSCTRNYCLINTGAPPAIVMGISGDPKKLIHHEKFKKNPVPLIRRFSGGGTVFINEETFFVSFICNSLDTAVASSPKAIFTWSEEIYRDVFSTFDFRLRENDYVIGDKKFGGNAEYLRKERWLHHTSFLFDYHPDQMECLMMPEKIPDYREKRSHQDFLCKLKPYFPSKDALLKKIRDSLKKRFLVEEIEDVEMLPLLNQPHRKATTIFNHEG